MPDGRDERQRGRRRLMPRLKPASSPYNVFWHVPVEGFRWVTTQAMAPSTPHNNIPGFDASKPHRFLTSGPLRGSQTVRPYNPLDESGLFRTFAATQPTAAAILNFANDYGALGEPTYLIGVPPGEPGTSAIVMRGDGQPVGRGEPLEAWVYEILRMRQTLDLWDFHQAGDLDALGQHIRWTDGRRVEYVSHPGVRLPVPAAKSSRPPAPYMVVVETIAEDAALELFTPGDVKGPTLWHIQRVINDHLSGRVSPRLLWNRDEERPRLRFRPASLIGVLWLQFAQAVDGGKTYRQCESCGKWFELSPDVARKHRIYCSDACRTRAYRKRVEHSVGAIKEGPQRREGAQDRGKATRTR